MNTLDNLSIIRLNIQLTKKCNQRCRSCNSYKLDTTDELSTDEIINMMEEAQQYFELENIAFTGGEPTIHSDISVIAESAKTKNVSITTNGYYFHSKEKLYELIKAGINRYSFSYHGIGKHDEFVGRKGAESKLRNIINWMSDECKYNSQLYAKIGILFDGSNFTDIEEMMNYVEELGLELYIEIPDHYIPIFYNSELSNKLNSSKCNIENVYYAIENFQEWKRKGRPLLFSEWGGVFMYRYFSGKPIKGGCPLGLTDVYIESNGNVRTGCWILDPIGNIKINSIKEIYESPKYHANIEKMLERDCVGCSCGYLMQAKYMYDSN